MFVREHRVDGAPPPHPAGAAGPEDRRALGTLLLIHGLGSWGQCFDRILDHPDLASWGKLVPDLPGHGRSPWPPTPASLTALVEGIARWLDDRDETALTLVGHSLGGVLAQILTERFPEHVRAVVDVEGNISSVDCFFSGRAAALSPIEFCESEVEPMIDEIYRAGLEDEALRDYHASLRMCDPRTFHALSVDLVSLSGSGTLAARLAALPVPVFYIAGSPGGIGHRSLALIQAAGLDCTIIEPAGHAPFIDQPDRFARALAGIVGRLPAG